MNQASELDVMQLVLKHKNETIDGLCAMIDALKQQMTTGYADRDEVIGVLQRDQRAVFKTIGQALTGGEAFPSVPDAAIADVQELASELKMAKVKIEKLRFVLRSVEWVPYGDIASS